MTKTPVSDTRSDLSDAFLTEYNSQDSIRKYTKETAGHGISYLLDHDYGNIYHEVIDKYIATSRKQKGIRLWEFGCGGGMNLLHLVSTMGRKGIALEYAYGTDFSNTLIEAAKREAAKSLTPEQHKKVHFCVATNENLIEDTTKGLRIRKEALLGSFDVVFGVNTIRYCHRLDAEEKCAEGVYNLLADGGVCIVIDMNQRFPAFRSRFRGRGKDKEATYLPSLDEYARPFSSINGFNILRKENFCWVPHSAGRGLTVVMKTLAPLLNSLVPGRAMRSLVIARKLPHDSV